MIRKVVLCMGILVMAAGLIGCRSLGVTRAGGLASWMTPPETRTLARTTDAQATDLSANLSGVQQRTVEVGGMIRTYYLYVPANLNGTPAPLVIALHGGGGEAQSFANRTGLFAMAENYGFILVVPEGVRSNWANGSDVGYADRSGVDDLAFIDTLITQTTATQPVAPGGAFAVGLSAGGMMTYHAACELPGRFRAIAVVAATLAAPDCSGGQGISVLHIHGTDDQSVPLAGGAGENTAQRANYPSVQSTLDLFEQRNACAIPTTTSPAQDTTCQISSCSGGDVVEFCAVEGGGHGWPGIETNARQERNGEYISPYFNATDYIAQFFLAH